MKKIVVFGTGKYYETKKISIEKEYSIIGFLDNSIKPGEMSEVDGKKAVNPEEYELFFAGVSVVLASARFWEMYMQLVQLGLVTDKIIPALTMTPAYDSSEVVLQKYAKNAKFSDNGLVLNAIKGVTELATNDDYEVYLRELFNIEHPEVGMICNLPLEPVSRRFGHEFGKPIDRVYIEKFLESHVDVMKGTLMEVAEDKYMSRYGHDIDRKIQIHINGWGKDVIKGNLVTGEGIGDEMVDCFVCTQTLTCLFDVDAAISNIYKLLKKDGSVLLTVSGFAQLSLYDYYKWGEYWRFTAKAMEEYFAKYFDKDKIEICTYGNVKTTTAFLYGICAEELEAEAYEYNDVQYPLIVAVYARK